VNLTKPGYTFGTYLFVPKKSPGASVWAVSPQSIQNEVVDTHIQSQLQHKTVLFNDEAHTYDYVVEMLTHTCELSSEIAFKCAVEVDLTGKTIVYTGTHENCLLAAQKINQYGPDHRLPHSTGSMNAEVQS